MNVINKTKLLAKAPPPPENIGSRYCYWLSENLEFIHNLFTYDFWRNKLEKNLSSFYFEGTVIS